MKKIHEVLILLFLCFNIICSDFSSLEEGTVFEINENIEGTTEYKTKTMTYGHGDSINYFKYSFSSNFPSNNVTAFRLDISPYSHKMNGYKVLCTNLANSASDADLKAQLEQVRKDESKSTCSHIFYYYGLHHSIMKLDPSKTKIGIAISFAQTIDTISVKINLRITERILGVNEEKPNFDETYSMIPMTIDIAKFRNSATPYISKLLFYSYSRVLYMYETVSNDYIPTKLFSGNILNVYTNPNQIRQKYHDAGVMTLMAYSFNIKEENFKFEVKKFESSFLLDYYVSSNPDGRPLNTPILINMNDCSNPYYVIVNYNAQDYGKTLVLDEIYGKMSYLGVATSLQQESWEDMIEKDIQPINLNAKKYKMPMSIYHFDVYKIQCTLPVLVNFYYIDELASVYTMKEGDVQIFSLKPYQTINVPFVEGLFGIEIMVEISQPENNPYVILKVTDEKVYEKNTLDRYLANTLSEGIVIKERGGSTDTRVIIKVGYSTNKWSQVSNYIKYDKTENIYAFEFPNDKDNKPFIIYTDLKITGENDDNNVKFCFTSSIGAALQPSTENCYRVSKTNSYTLTFYNPFIMYKNYDYDENYKYSITMKPVTEAKTFGIVETIKKYNTEERNYEGVNNKITIGSSGQIISVLTPPKIETNSIFLQIQVCDKENSIKTKVIDVLTQKDILSEEEIKAGTKNAYRYFPNQLMDTEFYVTGKSNTNIFLRMVGITTTYKPVFIDNQEIDFDESTNTLYIDSPLDSSENLRITVLVDKENVIKNKGMTLCSFVDTSFDKLAKYYKTVTLKNAKNAYIQLNFMKAGISAGEKFDAIVYIELLTKGQMVFLSEVYQGTVGQISLDKIYLINDTYLYDENYTHMLIDFYEYSYYFSYIPETAFDVPVGAFNLELGDKTTGQFSDVFCTFVSQDADAMTIIEEIETAIEEDKSYCIGSKSSVNEKIYNYIFKYEYEKDLTPKKLIIKVVNSNVNGDFSIYVKKDQGEEIIRTDFVTQQEYGRDESSKKSVIPYIVDVEKIRGNDTSDYVSKILFYSKYLEMQMYYIPTDSNKPIKLFCGNIALVYTKPALAEQKYHSKVLVLISENLEGKSHPSIGGTFRFHTKMFHPDSMIEFFVSQNPSGRTLNFPLSLEMNTCSKENNKLYYLLNYNEEEGKRNLHLDMIFGNYISARIATEINQNHWDDLLADSKSMTDIKHFTSELPAKSQHIDIIEIQCETPLLMNAYYTQDSFFYADIEKGGVAIKVLPKQSSFAFSLKTYDVNIFEYTISLYNPDESPDVTITFSDGTVHRVSGNTLQVRTVPKIPQKVTILNNCKSDTRFIFKFGLSVESTWKEEKITGINGNLYYDQKSFVYRFPMNDIRHKIKTVDLTVNAIGDNTNTKFCYSTNLGNAILTSRENCFRTGRFIPYTLTFINPLIVGKNYLASTEKYYVSFKPFDENDSIRIEIKENQYSITNRNDLGSPKELTITDKSVSTILTMPSQPMKIFFQIQLCKATTEPPKYILSNAYTGETLHSGKIYFRDPYGIHYISTLTFLENQIKLMGENANFFSKHSAISDDYELNINPDYSVSFDKESSVVDIIKPILGEPFTFTVIIHKLSLEDKTICDLAFASDITKLGDYVKTFTSISSDRIIHYVDFNSIGYNKGTKIWILIYAVQLQNTKMTFKYPVITGEVGTVAGAVKIDQTVEGQSEYMTVNFKVKSSSNYLYYDFPRVPTGNVSTLRIKSENSRVSKVGCIFVSRQATQEQMISEVNKALLEDRSVCVGGNDAGSNGFDALVNAKYTSENNRLVIQILYSFGDKEIKENTDASIIIKKGGTDLSNQGQYPSQEPYTAIPYVIDLLKIRGNKVVDYVSKILFYSNTREMQMFYIAEDEPKPVTLFTGNIMMVYTNEELIKQKYQGATTMILLTDSLSDTEKPHMGEQYRFITYFFTSDVNIQYFLSSNAQGRPLNNPTAIEMTSCTKPYYYILNYNKLEGKRKLHIDTVFGEKKKIKIATKLNEGSWDKLIENMDIINGDEVVLDAQKKFHFDVIEATCNVPLLINLFYVDPEVPKVTNLGKGDISILSLGKGEEETLTFILGQEGPFVYSFTIEKDSKIKPKITIIFDDDDSMNITSNGVYTKYWLTQYSRIVVRNSEHAGNTATRIIFKFGFAIEESFKKDENGIYTNKDDIDRDYNLYGYIYDQTSSKLNYTGVDFKVTTDEDNVKFCYSTNLGTYIYPSLQNCFRAGKNNPYTISTLNPYIMFKNYTSDENMNYYVGFRTVDEEQNIKIYPILKKYDTTERNIEGTKNKVKISSDTGEISTILTAPKNHEQFIHVEMCLCTKKTHVSYQFKNAYNSSNLGSDGQLNNNNVKITILNNPLLDTELKLYKGQNGDEIFVKHSGYNSNIPISPRKIVIKYDSGKQLLTWNPPLLNENFEYSIYIDKIDVIKKQAYTLCHIAEVTKLNHHKEIVISDSKTPNLTIDFNQEDLGPDFGDFDVIIVAEQLEKQKFTFISATYDSSGGTDDKSDSPSDDNNNNNPPPPKNEGDETGLIVIISILSVVIIGGGVAAVLIFLKYRKKGHIIEQNKQTSMALLGSTQQDKLVESQVEVDP